MFIAMQNEYRPLVPEFFRRTLAGVAAPVALYTQSMVPLERSHAINMTEYARVMKPRSWLIASVAFHESYIFDDATECDDGSLRMIPILMEIVRVSITRIQQY